MAEILKKLSLCPMPYIDKNHFEKFKPKRIVSLVPSITELLSDLGLEIEVLGITKFCVHPEIWIKQKTIIGGTKNLNLNRIKDLNPDLIIANKEENVQAQIEMLQQFFHVYLTDINTYEDALNLILDIGTLTHTFSIAKTIHSNSVAAFQIIQSPINLGKCLYLIWNEPLMAAGKNTYIDAMLSKVGFENVVHSTRYPEVDIEKINLIKPDYIFLSSEPYPFKAIHLAQFSKIFPSSHIKLVDGEMFSWYGSRMQYLPDYIFQTIKPTHK